MNEWERALRMKIGFICMAAVVGKEGDLKALTDDLVLWLRPPLARTPVKVPVRRGTGRGHVQIEELT